MKRRSGDERGFALLLVFLMAAAVALMLYKAMPRAAFETERDKEQLLIDRGNQYKRAVQLYYTQFRRYPSSIEDLESTNDKRFLRRRYVDPFTGKDDWRIVHTNGMFLTDSKVQAPPAQNANGQAGQLANGQPGQPGNGQPGAPGSTNGQGATSTFGATPGAPGATGFVNPTNPTNPNDPNAPPQVNSTVLARPSDRTLPGAQSFPANNAPGANLPPITYTGNAPNTNFNNNDPNSFPPITLFPNGYNAPAQGGATQANGQPQGLNRQPANQISNQNGFINPNVQTTPVDQLPPITLPPANQPSQPNQPGVPQGFNPQGLTNQPGLPGANNPGLPGANNPGLPNQAFQPGQFNLPGGLPPANLNGVTQGLAQQGLINTPANPQPVPNNIFNDPNNSSQPFQPGINGVPQSNPGFQNPPNNFQQNPANLIPPGAGGPNMPGAGTANQSALGIINQLLTTPRPPPPGIGPSQPASNQQQTIGGGIAGVASKFEGPSIKSYGGQTDFSKWEFIFQLQQGAGLTGVPPQGGVPPGGTLPGIPPSPTVPATR